MRTTTKKTKSKRSKKSKSNAKKVSGDITDAGNITKKTKARKDKKISEQTPSVKKSKVNKSLHREPDVSSDHKDTALDPNAFANNINPKESNKESDTVDGSNAGELKQERSSLEEILTEIIQTNKVPEDAHTEKISEETVDPEDTTATGQNKDDESLIQETDISYKQNDTAADPNVADGVSEVTAVTPEKGEEVAVSQIFEAIQKMTKSQGDIPGKSATAEKSTSGSTSEIVEDVQTEQVPEETIDPEDAAVEETSSEATDAGEVVEDTHIEEVSEEIIDPEDAAIEETSAEATDTTEIIEDAQTEQVPEEIVDPVDAADTKQNEEEPQLQEPDISSDQVDVTPDPNDADGIAEVPAAAPDITSGLPEICAKEIMQKQVTWASPDDSLQQAIAKMQQTNAGYILVGHNGAIEGIVSKSDLTKAMSPYLLPIFAKWRRPLDDATLKIRIKWIMSRPVRTIKPQTSLTKIMEHMSQFRGRCLPVMDNEGNVQGLVTAFDVFQALLKINSDTSSTVEASPQLVKQASSAETT